MIDERELDAIDWSSMPHAYGPADEVPAWLRDMASPDAETRRKAVSHFYSAVHHQGDVYASTTASLPFLLALADDPTTPGRAAIVGLLVSIGAHAVERCGYDYADGSDYKGSAVVVREHADAFVSYACDDDRLVRRAAIEGLGLFVDDADRAAALLRDRLPAEDGTEERLLVVETTATLALRLPAARDAATAWLDAVASDEAADPATRLAALVHGARCASERIVAGTMPQAIGLLRLSTPAPVTRTGDEAAGSTTGECRCAAPEEPEANGAPAEPSRNVPPQVVAAFEDLDRHNRTHSPLTSLLRTFHQVLDSRVAERTALLTEQIGSSDPAIRHDAIRMAKELMGARRGDHTALVTRLAGCLLPGHSYTAAEAAEVLGALSPIAEPAREALAAYVLAQRDTHGPEVWAAPCPLLRRAHQQAVMALARLGDMRALPCLLTALDGGVDAWRAVEVAGHLAPAADRLVPRLCRRLTAEDLSAEWEDMSTNAPLSALARLGDPAAVPAITGIVTASARHGQWRTAASALKALAAFGTAAAPALEAVRGLAQADDPSVRMAAAATLWAAEGDPATVVPLLDDLLDSHRRHEAADVLARIGPPAARVLPRLRNMLTADYEWTRAHAASALWDIGGPAEAPVVVRTLLAAWEENDATSNLALACFDRMGPAAGEALPHLRAELTRTRRSGRFRDVRHDEELQRMCRTVLARLS
ncbi:HEAT repeat domain-containing protein [Actinacidiphila glaucinigra]|uniref:HEAT repeat domain-containing protein n=1 Tax=Actinacidiphila glaucinigra TaxID=235986 RepID=UPI0032466B1F